MLTLIRSLGRNSLAFLDTLKGIGLLFIQTIYWTFVGPFVKKPASRRFIFHQMVFSGIQSIAIVFFVDFFIGLVLAMQSAYQLKELGATIYVAALVAVSMTREIGPVLTSLVIAGRVGAAITAELSTMKVTEQVEALETIALNPVRFLVVPRFLALLVMLPCLILLGDVIGVLGGFMVGITDLHLTPGLYMDTTWRFLELRDVMTGLFKGAVFSVLISMVCCYHGLSAEGGAEGVGKATTVSVVTSFILIIIADAILTAFFYMAGT